MAQRTDKVFAKLEHDFCWDPRVRRLNDALAFAFYIQAWTAAVGERREILPSHFDAAAIGQRAMMDPADADACLARCVEVGLLSLVEGRIRVLGVKSLHTRNFHWKDDETPTADNSPQLPTVVGEAEAEAEVEGEVDGEADKGKSKGSPSFAPGGATEGRLAGDKELEPLPKGAGQLIRDAGLSSKVVKRERERRPDQPEWILGAILATIAAKKRRKVRIPDAYFTRITASREPPNEACFERARKMVVQARTERNEGTAERLFGKGAG